MGLFQQITTAASREGLGFLVIGGLAVVHYGYSRDTADLDLLIRREERGRWLTIFLGLGYTVYQDKDVFVQLAPPQTGAWPVDLMLVRDPSFRELLASAVSVNMFDTEVLVPALEHLMALKIHALTHGHVERYLKDYLDLENLVRIHHVNLRAENIRRLFEKHGTLELHEKLSRTSTRE